jgi:D-threo-aldose 1-dehydrogenase
MSASGLPRRAIGQTGLSLTEIGLGAAPLGNLYCTTDDATAAETVAAALDGGLRYIDTAPFYGFGLSEQRIGQALRGIPDVVVSTKVGRLLRPASPSVLPPVRDGFHDGLPNVPEFDYSHTGIMRSWEASLSRMGLGRVDILLIHDIGRQTHGQDNVAMMDALSRGGGLRALQELRASGAVRAIGVGVNEIAACHEVLEHTDLDLILLAGRYTLLEQTALELLLPLCEHRGVSVVLGGIYNSGILATGTSSGGTAHYNYADAPAEVVYRVQQLESVCNHFGIKLAAAALQFALAHPQVASVIPGMATAEIVRSTLELRSTVIPPEFWDSLRTRNLLRPDAPLPVNPSVR